MKKAERGVSPHDDRFNRDSGVVDTQLPCRGSMMIRLGSKSRFLFGRLDGDAPVERSRQAGGRMGGDEVARRAKMN